MLALNSAINVIANSSMEITLTPECALVSLPLVKALRFRIVSSPGENGFVAAAWGVAALYQVRVAARTQGSGAASKLAPVAGLT
jgi:hypothetical protein